MSHGYDATEFKSESKSPITTHAGLNVGERKRDPKYVKYEDKPEEAKGIKDLREKAKLKDKPTTADGKKGLKDLPSVVAQVGNAASFLQNMYSMMSMVSAISGGGSQTSKKELIQDSLSGALAILVNRWGYDKVINVLDSALANDNIKIIDETYRELVINAIANLYKSAVEYGPNNVPIYSYSTVTVIGPVPSPLVTTVPDLYTQQYYIQADDPYPGYVRWNSPDNTEYVFTERKIGDKYYVSAQEEIYSISEEELAEALDPYIRDENLTARILNNLLLQQDENVEYNTNEKTLGKGTGGGGENAARLLMSLLGYISTITNLQKSAQLPFSVLSKGSINISLKSYEKRMTELKKMKSMLKSAATPPSPASLLSELSAVSSVVSTVQSVASTVQTVAPSVKLPNILQG